jgi:hypothetical protein
MAASRASRASWPVLSDAAINRATLARQLLLEPASMPVDAAVEALAGIQAQEPASPYLALWTRLARFDAADLDAGFRDRRIVKATLMRSTLHAVSRDDYRHLMPVLLPGFRTLRRRLGQDPPPTDRLARLAERSLAFAAVPRTNVELRDHAATLDAELARDVAWWLIRRYAAFVNVPVETTWSFGRRPTYVDAAVWLDGEAFAEPDAAVVHVVRRYLAAFGPAAERDASAWAGVPIARLRAGFAALDARGELVRFLDVRGRELLDLVDAPRPDPATEAPPRLLPMWDSLLLAHADRTRVMSDEHRRLVIGRNGDTLPTFLVDGRVAGLWWAEADVPGARIVLEPFGRLSAAERAGLEAEGERLAAFIAPFEPDVYRRYRASRARR